MGQPRFAGTAGHGSDVIWRRNLLGQLAIDYPAVCQQVLFWDFASQREGSRECVTASLCPKSPTGMASSPNLPLCCIRIPQSRFSSTVFGDRNSRGSTTRCPQRELLSPPHPIDLSNPLSHCGATPLRNRCSCRTLNGPPLRSHFTRAARCARWHTASRARAAAYLPMPCTPTPLVSRSWLAESVRHCLHRAQP